MLRCRFKFFSDIVSLVMYFFSSAAVLRILFEAWPTWLSDRYVFFFLELSSRDGTVVKSLDGC